MKKITLLLAGLMFVSTIMGQDKHLEFMGTPINGKITEFVNNLHRKGFVDGLQLKSKCFLRGQFSGAERDVLVISTPKSNTMYEVTVFVNDMTMPYTIWPHIKRDYETFKTALIQKYGTPIQDTHLFIEPYFEGDGMEMTALKNDKVVYGTIWEFDNGKISLLMLHEAITITYQDKYNWELNNAENNYIISSDL